MFGLVVEDAYSLFGDGLLGVGHFWGLWFRIGFISV